MKATCWYGENDIRMEDVPDPKILNPRDAVVKITRPRSAVRICIYTMALFPRWKKATSRPRVHGRSGRDWQRA